MADFVEELKKGCLARGGEAMNYHSFSASTLDAEALVQTALTMPLFGGRRLLVVKDCTKLKDRDKKTLIAYAEKPSADSTVVLLYGEARPSVKDSLYATLKRLGYVKEFRAPKGGSLLEWAAEPLSAAGYTIEPQALTLLVELAGGSLSELRAEIEKLIIYKGSSRRITPQDVEQVVFGSEDVNVFELTDAIGRKDRATLLRGFGRLRDDPLKILGAIAWYVRLLIRCRELIDRGATPGQIKEALPVAGFRVKAFVEAARGFSPRRLNRLMLLIQQTDRMLKGSPLDGEDIMFRLFLELCR